MTSSCVVKYGPVSIVSGTTLYYKVANGSDDTIVYGISGASNATCPGTTGTFCSFSVVINGTTDRAVTSYGIVQGGC
jgi:hypothetical protein